MDAWRGSVGGYQAENLRHGMKSLEFGARGGWNSCECRFSTLTIEPRRRPTLLQLNLAMWPVLPDYGYFPRWPQDGQGWIHPDDVPLVTRLVPSERVFKRVSFDETYYHYRYGRHRFRLRPAMWLKVKYEGFDLGDAVETTGLSLERELFVADVVGMYFVKRKGRLAYRLRRAGQLVPGLFLAEQMRLLKDKATVRPGDTIHPAPKWNGQGERMDVGKLDLGKSS